MNQTLRDARWFQKAIISPYLPLIAITLLGALLRFHQLGEKPLSGDEPATWRFAQLPFSQLWGEGAVRETNPPLYYTLQKLWLIFGESEVSLRSLSAIIGTITIPIVYGVGQTLGGHWLGLIASALVATSKINIEYSQQARTYALQTAASALSIWGLAYLLTNFSQAATPIAKGLIRSLRYRSSITKSNRKDLIAGLAWLAYIFGVVVALYSHNTAVLLLILTNLIACIWWVTTGCFNKQFFFNWLIANIIPLLIWSWWIPKIIQQTAITLSDFWIPTPTIGSLVTTLFTLYGPQRFFLLSSLALLGTWYWRQQQVKINLTLILSIGTIVLGFLISLWRPIFITKIFLWTTIPFFVLVSAGFLALRKKLLITIALIIILSIQLQGVGKYYKSPPIESWDQLASYVQPLVKENDLILLFPSTIDAAFQYYFHSKQPNVIQYGLRRWKFNIPRLPHTRVIEIQKSKLSELVQEFHRIWLVTRGRNSEDPQDLVILDISKKMAKLNHLRFNGNIEVFLFGQAK